MNAKFFGKDFPKNSDYLPKTLYLGHFRAIEDFLRNLKNCWSPLNTQSQSTVSKKIFLKKIRFSLFHIKIIFLAVSFIHRFSREKYTKKGGS